MEVHFIMTKHTKELKLRVVKAYLNNEGGYRYLANTYHIRDYSQVKKWIELYNYYGEQGLERKHKKRMYSSKFKLDVINYRKQTRASHMEVAKRFGLNNPSLIANWERKLSSQGVEGLSKSIRRPSMKKKTDQEEINANDRLKELEEENECLKIENIYLKKLKAYLENPQELSDRRKSRLSKNLKKKDSN